jgi:hypothetical protein
MERGARFHSLFYITSIHLAKFPSQIAHREREREKCSVLEPSFNFLSVFPVKGPPLPPHRHISQRGPYGERCTSQETAAQFRRRQAPGSPGGLHGEWCPSPEPSFPYPSGSPPNEPHPPGSPNRASAETDAPFPDPSFTLSQNTTKWNPRCPNGAPKKETPISRGFSYPSPNNATFRQSPQ